MRVYSFSKFYLTIHQVAVDLILYKKYIYREATLPLLLPKTDLKGEGGYISS